MRVSYYRFRDGGGATLRYGVSSPGEPDELVEDLFDPELGKWLNYAEVSRYVFFERREIVEISLAEAMERTNGHAGDPADGVIPCQPPVFNGPYID